MVHEVSNTLLQLFISVITAGVTVIAWRYRDRPGGRPFVGLMGVITLISATPAIITSHTHVLTEFWNSAFFALAFLWLLFVLEYTGATRFVNTYTVSGLSLATLVLIAPFWMQFLDEMLLYEGSPFVLLQFVYVFGLIGIGILLLLKFVISENRLPTGQAVALGLGMAAPFAVGSTGILYILGIITVDPGPLLLPSFGVAGLAFAVALYWFELFSVLPVVRHIGRNAAIEDLQEGVFIVDTEGQIVDVNQQGADILQQPPSALISQTLQTVLGDHPSNAADEIAPAEFETDDGRVFRITVSQIQDRADQLVGWTVVFRDVTDQELRKTQLEVLNRVLRHNLRNKLSVIQSHAEFIADRDADETRESLEQHKTATTDLLEIGERAREFEQLKSREQASPSSVNIASIFESLIEQVTEEFPTVEVTTTVPPELTVETYPDALRITLENLLRNAAEHSDQPHPEIEVTVTSTNEEVEISIRDDGPGIPEHELTVLDADAETALEHGSGLGLWITKWAVQYLRGDLVFEDTDPRGTTAIVTIPWTVAREGSIPAQPTRPATEELG